LARVFAVVPSFAAFLPFAGGRRSLVRKLSPVIGTMCVWWMSRSSTAVARMGIGEHLAPQFERLVAGQDDRAAFVSLGNDAEDVVGDAEFHHGDALSRRRGESALKRLKRRCLTMNRHFTMNHQKALISH